jgi:hypothetical protein
MVVTCLSAARETGSKHDRTASPSNVNSAGPTLRHAASVFNAGQAEVISEHPKERGGRVSINSDVARVYGESNQDNLLALGSGIV